MFSTPDAEYNKLAYQRTWEQVHLLCLIRHKLFLISLFSSWKVIMSELRVTDIRFNFAYDN